MPSNAATLARVWIAPLDGADAPRWIVNDEDDMRGNYDDGRDEGSISDDVTFAEYLDSWDALDVPADVLTADDATRDAWIDAHV